ncbi:hypothetical protein EE612_037388 [Oryza sativa]|nr:hypothetical protein EE612_037388 [Oryza sativa]
MKETEKKSLAHGRSRRRPTPEPSSSHPRTPPATFLAAATLPRPPSGRIWEREGHAAADEAVAATTNPPRRRPAAPLPPSTPSSPPPPPPLPPPDWSRRPSSRHRRRTAATTCLRRRLPRLRLDLEGEPPRSAGAAIIPPPPPPRVVVAATAALPQPPSDQIWEGRGGDGPARLTTAAAAAAARSPEIVKVRSVWAHNLDEEANLIESLFPSFRLAAVDTEFPGTVHRPSAPAYTLTRKQKYALLKKNVDELHLVQLGLTLFDAGGRLPDLGTGGAARYVWEFNFREFDLRRHAHAPESIALLRSKGVDFDRTRRGGVDAAAFGPRLRRWLRAGLGRAGLVTFSGAYDLAYMLKMLYGGGGGGYRLPGDAATFEFVVRAVIGRTLYDVGKMARHCPGDMRGGLERVAGKLGVRRAVGEAHQAGSDSLLTSQMFMRMRERYFDDQDALTAVAGINFGYLNFTSCEYT